MNSGTPLTDEVRDPSEVMSPILQLAVMEFPKVAATETTTATGDWRKIDNGHWSLAPSFNEPVKPSAEQEEPHRHRHRGHHNGPDEQADEATSPFHHRSRKHKNGRLPRPTPTLATIEDHDFMTESEDEFVKKFNVQMLRSNHRSARRRSTRKILQYKRKHLNRL